MSQKFLNCADVIAIFDKMGSKTVTQCVHYCVFRDALYYRNSLRHVGSNDHEFILDTMPFFQVFFPDYFLLFTILSSVVSDVILLVVGS